MNLKSLEDSYPSQLFSDEIYNYLDDLPDEFRNSLINIEFLVEDFPPSELKNANKNISRYTMGLYSGVPVPSKSIFQKFSLPDIIYLFRIPILNYHLRTKKPVKEIIHGVLRHEIAHFFGYTDEDLHSENLYNP